MNRAIVIKVLMLSLSMDISNEHGTNSNSHLDSVFAFLPDTVSTGFRCYTGIFSKSPACLLVNTVQGSI